MTKEVKEILNLVDEMKSEFPKVQLVPYYYKSGDGKRMIRAKHDKLVFSPRYLELLHGNEIRGRKIFKCQKCGEMVDYFDLESWVCDFETGKYKCSDCYENDMGDDL